jgi:hypothetical protein
MTAMIILVIYRFAGIELFDHCPAAQKTVFLKSIL